MLGTSRFHFSESRRWSGGRRATAAGLNAAAFGTSEGAVLFADELTGLVHADAVIEVGEPLRACAHRRRQLARSTFGGVYGFCGIAASGVQDAAASPNAASTVIVPSSAASTWSAHVGGIPLVVIGSQQVGADRWRTGVWLAPMGVGGSFSDNRSSAHCPRARRAAQDCTLRPSSWGRQRRIDCSD